MGLISGGGRGRGGFGMAHLLLLIIGVLWLSFSSVEGVTRVKCYTCRDDGCKAGEEGCPGKLCVKETSEVDGKKWFIKDVSSRSMTRDAKRMEARRLVKGDLCNASTKKYSPDLVILLAASTFTVLITFIFD